MFMLPILNYAFGTVFYFYCKKMKYILFIFSVFIFISCNIKSENEKTGDDTATDKDDKIARNISGCYMKISGRDTVILMLDQQGENLSGKMIFDNYQYDGSRGTVSGRAEGEIIKLWYDFFAEGMHSMMEIYFKEDNGNLLRGMGKMDISGDTSYFKSSGDITYSPNDIFLKTDCSLPESKLNFNW